MQSVKSVHPAFLRWKRLPETPKSEGWSGLRDFSVTQHEFPLVIGTPKEKRRNKREWIIPAVRVKTGRPHVVPLTHTMLSLIGPQERVEIRQPPLFVKAFIDLTHSGNADYSQVSDWFW